MVKRSLYAVVLAAVGLLSVGCGWGGLGGWWGYSGAIDNVPRIITAILHEDFFS